MPGSYLTNSGAVDSYTVLKGNVNVCLIFPNLPNGFETGTIKMLSLIIFVGMLGQAIFVFRLSYTAVYLRNSLAQQMATYVI